jgi:hypothetical protein
MNIKSIITSLVLAGSSSAAVASPVTFSGNAYGSIRIGEPSRTQSFAGDDRRVGRDRDEQPIYTHRYDPATTIVRPRPEPVNDTPDNVKLASDGSYYRGHVGQMPRSGHASIALTEPTKILNGREIIDVGTDKGVFSQLTLRANSGETYVRGVRLILGKDDVQWVPLNASLDGRNPAISFDVDNRRGRMIQQIIVIGSSNPRSRYSITAER